MVPVVNHGDFAATTRLLRRYDNCPLRSKREERDETLLYSIIGIYELPQRYGCRQ